MRGHLHDGRTFGGKGECKKGFGFRIAHPKAIAISTHLLERSRLHVCPPPQHTSIVITSTRCQAGISPDAQAGQNVDLQVINSQAARAGWTSGASLSILKAYKKVQNANMPYSVP